MRIIDVKSRLALACRGRSHNSNRTTKVCSTRHLRELRGEIAVASIVPSYVETHVTF